MAAGGSPKVAKGLPWCGSLFAANKDGCDLVFVDNLEVWIGAQELCESGFDRADDHPGRL